MDSDTVAVLATFVCIVLAVLSYATAHGASRSNRSANQAASDCVWSTMPEVAHGENVRETLKTKPPALQDWSAAILDILLNVNFRQIYFLRMICDYFLNLPR
jgi:hypothetical protein